MSGNACASRKDAKAQRTAEGRKITGNEISLPYTLPGVRGAFDLLDDQEVRRGIGQRRQKGGHGALLVTQSVFLFLYLTNHPDLLYNEVSPWMD